MIVTNDSELVAAINARISDGARLIAIDGVGNAGKSRARAQILQGIGGTTGIELDDFLDRGQAQFVDALRFAELKEAVRPAKVLIMSGVCMRDVLLRLDIEADVHVYVKRMLQWGWGDQDVVENDGHIEEIADVFGIDRTYAYLDIEVRRYHQYRRPQDSADIVYERMDGSTGSDGQKLAAAK